MSIQPNPLFIPPHPLRQPRHLDLAAQKAHIKSLWPQVYTGEPDAKIQRFNTTTTASTEGMASTPDDYFY